MKHVKQLEKESLLFSKLSNIKFSDRTVFSKLKLWPLHLKNEYWFILCANNLSKKITSFAPPNKLENILNKLF